MSLFALQFAKMLGARAIVTSSSDEKLARAKRLGADEMINYRDVPDWGKRAREVAGPGGVDLVIDLDGSVGESARTVRTSGTVVLVGVLGGAATNLDLGPVVTRAVRLQAATVGSRAMFEEMVRAMELHRLEPVREDAPRRYDGAADRRGAGRGRVRRQGLHARLGRRVSPAHAPSCTIQQASAALAAAQRQSLAAVWAHDRLPRGRRASRRHLRARS